MRADKTEYLHSDPFDTPDPLNPRSKISPPLCKDFSDILFFRQIASRKSKPAKEWLRLSERYCAKRINGLSRHSYFLGYAPVLCGNGYAFPNGLILKTYAAPLPGLRQSLEDKVEEALGKAQPAPTTSPLLPLHRFF